MTNPACTLCRRRGHRDRCGRRGRRGRHGRRGRRDRRGPHWQNPQKR